MEHRLLNETGKKQKAFGSAHARNPLPKISATNRFWKWYQHHAKRRGVGLEINGHVLAATPIHKIDFADPTDKARHTKIVAKVDAMMEAKEQLANAKTDRDRNFYQSKCAALDRQIDRLVYDLYGLTEAEIQIVEQQKSMQRT